MRRCLMFCAAAILIATGLLATNPAQAQFRVIRWNATGICQIYDFGWGGPPIPYDYHMMTPPLPNFAVALDAKAWLWHRGHCSI